MSIIGLLPPTVPFVTRDDLVSKEWYMFLQFLYLRTGGAVSQTNNELITGQFDDAGIEDIKLDLYALRDQAASALIAIQEAIDDVGSAPPSDANNFYDPANVAITGGAIDATTIGSTTATTGKFSDITNGNLAALIKTSVAMNNGAAAAAGTLLNAPAAGNPTKWVPFDDNGTIRYIPAW